jgi:hypothetical protein
LDGVVRGLFQDTALYSRKGTWRNHEILVKKTCVTQLRFELDTSHIHVRVITVRQAGFLGIFLENGHLLGREPNEGITIKWFL